MHATWWSRWRAIPNWLYRHIPTIPPIWDHLNIVWPQIKYLLYRILQISIQTIILRYLNISYILNYICLVTNNTTWPREVLRSTKGSRHSLVNLKLTHHWSHSVEFVWICDISQLTKPALDLQSWCATCSGVPGCCAGEHAETVCSSGLLHYLLYFKKTGAGITSVGVFLSSGASLQECQLDEFGRCPLVILNLAGRVSRILGFQVERCLPWVVCSGGQSRVRSAILIFLI
jgi:hypothetical protein